MVTIESTPEMATKVYETMAHNLRIVRRRLGRPLTLADKVLLGHLDDPEHQDMEPGTSYLQLRPTASCCRMCWVKLLCSSSCKPCATPSPCPRPSTVTISFKRGSKARQICAPPSRKIRKSMPSRLAAAKYGTGFWAPGAGIIHQVVLEQYAFLVR